MAERDEPFGRAGQAIMNAIGTHVEEKAAGGGPPTGAAPEPAAGSTKGGA